MLHISGWYDDVQRGTTVNFSRMTGDCVNEKIARRSGSCRPVGPRLTTLRSRRSGRVDFGPGAELDLRAFELEWLEQALGDDPAARHEPARPPVRDGPKRVA